MVNLKKDKIFNLFYDDGNLVFVNLKQDWQDETIKLILRLLNIQLKSNVEMYMGDELFFGIEDDYIIHIPMDESSVIIYYESILNKYLTDQCK